MKTSRHRDRSVAIGFPGQPPGCRGRVTERARLEWWVGEPGEPGSLIEDMLRRHNLLLPDLAGMPPGGCDPAAAGSRCGAAVLVSTAACNLLAGRPAGPASPAPGVPDVAVVVYEHAPPPTPLWHPVRPPRLGPWRPSWRTSDHAAAVREVRRAISRGDVYQVNVVGHWSAAYHGDPTGALAAVAGLPGARYAGAIQGDGWAVACASPEALVTAEAGRVETRPIKGTRVATPAGRAELLGSAKERAEHVMIVDLERNDLSRIARTGSVRVTELFGIRRWCDLWQAESVVTAELAPHIGLAELLRALCPGGSVTGAPKLAAIDQIAALEPVGRGPSMAAIGYVTPYRIDVGLTIRTVAFDAGAVHLWAGGGITWDSDPASEVAEAAAKAEPLMATLAATAAPRRVAATS
ncbi:MAG: chorismate-binding protein [Micromonosporaceae bacterium]